MHSNKVFTDLAKTLEIKSMETYPIYEGDYQKDGLWFCGKCNTPKQSITTLNDIEFRPMIPCKCEQQRIDQEKAKCKHNDRVGYLKRIGLPDCRLVNFTFENDDGKDQKTLGALKKYVDLFTKFETEGKGLLLHGNTGTGKTYAMACVVNALIEKEVPCLMTSISSIISDLQAAFDSRNEILERLLKFKLIALDDFSVERNTEYMQGEVYTVINTIYNANIPMIITTNLSLNEFSHPQTIMDQRINSRIIENCHPIEVNNVNRRNKKIASTYAEINELLGID